MAAIPQISADSISSLGDPWVAEAHKRRVQSIVQAAGGDYRKAAVDLMSIDPAAAAQLSKLAMHQQSLGQSASHHAEDLAMRREALDKPTVHWDSANERFFEYRPRAPEGQRYNWVQEPGGGQPRPGGAQPAQSMQPPPMQSPAPMPPPQRPPPSGVPSVSQPAPQRQGALPPLPDGVDESDIADLAGKPPPYRRAFETHFGLPSGGADALVNAYSAQGRRSDLGGGEMTEGGNMRVAGEGLELPEAVGQAFAQETPPQYNQRLTPARPPPPGPGEQYPGPIEPRPRDPIPLSNKGQREVDKSRATERAKLEEKEYSERAQAAGKAIPFLDVAKRMEDYATKAAAGGVANQFMQMAPIAGGLKLARGIYDTIGQTAPERVQASKWAELYENERAKMEVQAAEAFKGQGQISDGEREILRRGLPPLALMNTPEGRLQIRTYRATLYDVIRKGGYSVPGVD